MPTPVLPLALQLLTVLEATAEIPPDPFSAAVLLVISARFGPAIPAPVLRWALQSITVRLFTPLGAIPAPPLLLAKHDLIVEAVPSRNP